MSRFYQKLKSHINTKQVLFRVSQISLFTHMKNENKYQLEKGSKKFLCPNCGNKTFVRYIDDANKYLPEQYGRCDREIKCSYHNSPYRNGYDRIIKRNFENIDHRQGYPWKPEKKTEPVFIPEKILKLTLKPEDYDKNFFIQNLLNHVKYSFSSKDIEAVISQYYLGTITNGYRAGATTFPFIDKDGHVRTIQVKQFDSTNHTTGTDFLHSMLDKYYQQKRIALPSWLEEYKKNDLKVSCLFGEHLLRKFPNNPVALVEAPKTAIYGTLYFGFPEQDENLLWLAVYNLSSLNFEKCKALKGRNVYLFPDLSENGKAFELWNNKAKDIASKMPDSHFEVSDLLESLAPKSLRIDGADIGDVLIKLDWRAFRPTPLNLRTSNSVNNSGSEKSEKSELQKKQFISHSNCYTSEQIQDLLELIHPEKDFIPYFLNNCKNVDARSWVKQIVLRQDSYKGILPTNPNKLVFPAASDNSKLFMSNPESLSVCNYMIKSYPPNVSELLFNINQLVNLN